MLERLFVLFHYSRYIPCPHTNNWPGLARAQNYSTEALNKTGKKAAGSPKDLFVQAQINPQEQDQKKEKKIHRPQSSILETFKMKTIIKLKLKALSKAFKVPIF